MRKTFDRDYSELIFIQSSLSSVMPGKFISVHDAVQLLVDYLGVCYMPGETESPYLKKLKQEKKDE